MPVIKFTLKNNVYLQIKYNIYNTEHDVDFTQEYNYIISN